MEVRPIFPTDIEYESSHLVKINSHGSFHLIISVLFIAGNPGCGFDKAKQQQFNDTPQSDPACEPHEHVTPPSLHFHLSHALLPTRFLASDKLRCRFPIQSELEPCLCCVPVYGNRFKWLHVVHTRQEECWNTEVTNALFMEYKMKHAVSLL